MPPAALMAIAPPSSSRSSSTSSTVVERGPRPARGHDHVDAGGVHDARGQADAAVVEVRRLDHGPHLRRPAAVRERPQAHGAHDRDQLVARLVDAARQEPVQAHHHLEVVGAVDRARARRRRPSPRPTSAPNGNEIIATTFTSLPARRVGGLRDVHRQHAQRGDVTGQRLVTRGIEVLYGCDRAKEHGLDRLRKLSGARRHRRHRTAGAPRSAQQRRHAGDTAVPVCYATPFSFSGFRRLHPARPRSGDRQDPLAPR